MNDLPLVSVIIPTHNPELGRLKRTLHGLREQTLPAVKWETIIVNNASERFPSSEFFRDVGPPNSTVIEERSLGLSFARATGFHASRSDCAVLVDDDNVLQPDYLARAHALSHAYPHVGVFGGKSLPDFERSPPDWTREFFPLLALRDAGDTPQISKGLRPPGAKRDEYPLYAPLGAGMVLRRPAWLTWLEVRRAGPPLLSDRRGSALTSSGDNDIVLCSLRAGWEVAYFPELVLTHVIPSGRLESEYLARLNHGIQQSWMQVLSLHNVSPWPPLAPFEARLKKLKAWFVHRPWRSPVARIRWAGACGHFDGRVPNRS
jgi:glycosyltransferase involved in cell wall biosynthesis